MGRLQDTTDDGGYSITVKGETWEGGREAFHVSLFTLPCNPC